MESGLGLGGPVGWVLWEWFAGGDGWALGAGRAYECDNVHILWCRVPHS